LFNQRVFKQESFTKIVIRVVTILEIVHIVVVEAYIADVIEVVSPFLILFKAKFVPTLYALPKRIDLPPFV
jgi:hypothetical protein